ncbi:TatD family hydrolase [uncultured Metabacillus sp.]|uniref:TatD family hydrolase n=1 Tax=uncultured Metabacillus sp. TaxID=2860135 RepID=UPI00260698D2|nr:TatD family hydrolase [uncultured Metabacillus sp.]
MIDAHIHLDQYHSNLDEAILRWQENGIEAVVAVASNLQSSYEILKLKQRFPEFVYAAIGHHPEAPPPASMELAELLDLIKQERKHLSAIGEIGLPTYRKKELYERYKEEEYIFVLEEFLQMAKEIKLPVVLHAVHEEAKNALTCLKRQQIPHAHFHWLKAREDVVSDIVSSGYYVSVTPEVCYRERDQKLARQIPMDQLLIETDGPWKYHGPFKERETSPLLLKEISECLSNILTIPIHSLREKVTTNTKRFYTEGTYEIRNSVNT